MSVCSYCWENECYWCPLDSETYLAENCDRIVLSPIDGYDSTYYGRDIEVYHDLIGTSVWHDYFKCDAPRCNEDDGTYYVTFDDFVDEESMLSLFGVTKKRYTEDYNAFKEFKKKEIPVKEISIDF